MTATMPTEDRVAFGDAIKSALVGAGHNQAWLEKAMGVSNATVSAWVNGDSPPRTPYRVFELERVLGIPPGTLSQHLGYVPVGVSGDTSLPSIVETLRSDPSISDSVRNTLLNLLRSMGVITE